MKYLSVVGKVAAVSTSVLLAGGYVCYQAGYLGFAQCNARQPVRMRGAAVRPAGA